MLPRNMSPGMATFYRYARPAEYRNYQAQMRRVDNLPPESPGFVRRLAGMIGDWIWEIFDEIAYRVLPSWIYDRI